MSTRTKFIITSLIAATGLCTSLLAGPPLLCHPIKVEAGQLLPCEKPGSSSPDDAVDAALKLLNAQTPVLTRMETLRRATLCIEKDASKADLLMGTLMTRILEAEAAGKPDSLAWFDAGYLAACLDQAGIKTRFGPTQGKDDGAQAIAGYSWVIKAIDLSNGNPHMELAAALMTADHRVPEHRAHLKNALTAGKMDAATEDLLTWIAQINGTTLDALRGQLGVADAGNAR